MALEHSNNVFDLYMTNTIRRLVSCCVGGREGFEHFKRSFALRSGLIDWAGVKPSLARGLRGLLGSDIFE